MRRNIFISYLIGTILIFISCSESKQNNLVNSDGTLKIKIDLDSQKRPFFKLFHKDQIILDTSYLGIKRKDQDFFSNITLKNISEGKYIEDNYTMFQGKQKEIKYTALQYKIELENKNGMAMNIIFNLSNDGVAFKYIFSKKSESVYKIEDEKTTYNFVTNTKSWLQPMSKAKTGWEQVNPSYEEHYLSAISVDKKSPIGEGWVYPALFNTNDTWVLISETGLHSKYSGTRLIYNNEYNALKVSFPQKEEVFPDGALKPEAKTPWETPWRILTIGNLKTITESTLGTDLANKAIEMDTSFIKSGLSSWSWVLLKDDFTNYETSIKFIDYASEMNWDYCLIDADWDQKIGYEKMNELTKYAALKNVKLLVWYNSAGSWNTTPYTPKDKLLTSKSRKEEFKKLNEIAVSGVKIDFFGGDGQSMIAYYHAILKDAAKHKLLVNFHGATLPRGWQRTYPNLMTVEAIKGEEFITFEQANADLQPSHSAILPFTRNVFDPMDFTPMVLDSIPGIHRRTSKSFELALPVLFLSGIQHMAETPDGMKKQPDYVIDYLKDIPTNWDESKFITGYPGKDVVMARRKNNTWFIVGINGENKQKTLQLDLSFIDNKNGFVITDNNRAFKKIKINSKNLTTIQLDPNGGFVAKF
ncbi:glycoside hydrolase family 97 catalytic domain-containing protein [Polaribacter sp.]|uniref:glycoside hydrolase family 97 protein n=1 Tax=Polaribacter sp. TaxID=1920175 RepID=UPI003F6B71A4